MWCVYLKKKELIIISNACSFYAHDDGLISLQKSFDFQNLSNDVFPMILLFFQGFEI